MKQSLILLLFSSILFLLSACNGCNKGISSGDALQRIPADVTMVYAVHLDRFLPKMDFEKVRNMEFYVDNANEVAMSNIAFGDMLKNPEEAGIDLKKSLYLVYTMLPTEGNPVFSSCMVFHLNRPGGVEDVLKKHGLTSFRRENGYKAIQLDQFTVFAWDDEILVLGSTVEYTDLAVAIAPFFTTEASNSIANNKSLQEALQGEHDMEFWANSNELAKNVQLQMALTMFQIPADALKDNILHGFVDFEVGSVFANLKYDLKPALANELNKLFKDKPQTDFSPYIPGVNLAFAFTNAINLKGIDEILSAQPQAKGFVEFALREYGLSVKDIVETFNGDLMLMGAYNPADTVLDGLFATRIESQEKLDRFLQLGQERNIFRKVGAQMYQLNAPDLQQMEGSFSMGTTPGTAYLVVKDDLVLIGGDLPMLTLLQDNTFPPNSRIQEEYRKDLQNNLFGAYIGPGVMANFSDDLQNMLLRHGRLRVGRSGAEMEIKLMDEANNALRVLMREANKQHMLEKEAAKEANPI